MDNTNLPGGIAAGSQKSIGQQAYDKREAERAGAWWATLTATEKTMWEHRARSLAITEIYEFFKVQRGGE